MCETLRFKFRRDDVQLAIYRVHLGTFLSGGHWDIGDVYIHTSGLVPSMQLRRAAIRPEGTRKGMFPWSIRPFTVEGSTLFSGTCGGNFRTFY